MRIKLDAPAFAAAATWAARYAMPARGGTHPGLTGVLAVFDGETLTLSATDYERWGQVEVPASGEPGRVLLPAGLLAQVAKILADEPMTLEVDGTRARVECGRARFELPTISADGPAGYDMPATLGTVDGDAFAAAAKRVAVAAGRDERQLSEHRAVFVEAAATGVWLAATNRHCVSAETVMLTPAGDVHAELLVPATVIADLAGEVEGPATLYGDRSAFAVAWPGHTVRSTVTNASAPPYRRVLSQFPDRTWVEVEIAALVDAVRHVEIAAPGTRDRPTLVTLDIGPGEIDVRAGDGDTKGAEAVAAAWDGPEFAAKFQSAYLLAALGTLPAGTARIGFAHTDGTVATVAFAAPDPVTDHQFLVQPLTPKATS